MASTPSSLAERRCSPAAPAQAPAADATDAQLLEQFVRAKDEAAFAELVRRHSTMVLGVCRRILRNSHDAEDCFQAVFLVLVRKAATIWPRAMVGNWLYGVAYRTALEARKMAARRRAIERQKQVQPSPASLSLPQLWQELQPVLDQELSRLSDKYRAVLVLCDLEGKTRAEAAVELGLPPGTVASRLSRARALLARRLTRHSLRMSTGLLAAVLTQHTARAAAAPPALIAATTRAGAELMAGKPAAGLLAPEVVALADRVSRVLLLSKLKLMLAVLIVLTLLGLSISGYAPSATTDGKREDWHLQAAAEADKGRPREQAQHYLVQQVDLANLTIHVAKLGFSASSSLILKLQAAADVPVFIDGQLRKLSELKSGVFVNVEFEQTPAGVYRALRIEVVGEKVEGVVLAMNGKDLTVQCEEEAGGRLLEKICDLTQSAKVVIDGKKAKFADLKAKMKVTLLVSAGKPSVVGIEATGPRVEGEIKAINGKKRTISVHVKNTPLAAEDVPVAKDASILINGKAGTLADLAPGARVTLQMSAETDRSVVVGIEAKR